MTPLAAIRSATTTAAECMGWADRVGSLAPGRFADLVAVDGDPLADMTRARAAGGRRQGRSGRRRRPDELTRRVRPSPCCTGIDHLVIAVRDPDAAAAVLSATSASR